MGEREANVKQVAMLWHEIELFPLYTPTGWLTDWCRRSGSSRKRKQWLGRAGTWFLKKNDFAVQIDFAFYTQRRKSGRSTPTCGVRCNIHLKFHPLDISAFERMLFIIITDSGRTDGRARALGVVKSNLKSLSIFIPRPHFCVFVDAVCTESAPTLSDTSKAPTWMGMVKCQPDSLTYCC